MTAAVLVAEFLFVIWLCRFDDAAQAEMRTTSRAQVALAQWRPGEPRAPVVAELRALPGTRASLGAWSETGDPAALASLRGEVKEASADANADLSSAHRRVALILAGVLGLVSAGWFVWFRRLVLRHREVQRRLTERETLDAGEHRLLALVQNSTDLVVVVSPDSTATFVSPASATVLGWSVEEVMGRPLDELLIDADRPLLAQLLQGARTEESGIQLGMRHRDGRELVMEGTLTDLRGDSAVAGFVLTVRDVTERQRLQDDLARRALRDSLTGLANRQLFYDRLGHALKRSGGTREAAPLAVLFLDLDDFKDVNDGLGHAAGDELLARVAHRIDAAMRAGDTAARLGGDEFAVLLEDADLTTATQIAYRLLAELKRPFDLDGQAHQVRASIGLAEAIPGLSDGAEIVRNAEVAMYMAKGRGKGGVAVYDSEEHQRALATVTLQHELEVAITAGELVVHYQPTVDLRTERVTGFEALVRWQHPQRGLLGPLEFIPLAEQSGLIVPLGTWVLRRAVEDCMSLQSGDQRPTVAVNVAAKQLTQPDFRDVVLTALTDSGLPADRLVLEITETALLEDLDLGVRTLTQLRKHGIRVAIDDFGTGYSSFAHLARLPVDVLKVDKSFIDHVVLDQDSDVLVAAILAMSRGLRLTTVAEGVEEPDQARWLREAGCDLGQGYLWSRPVDLPRAEMLLHGSRTGSGSHGAQEIGA